MRCSVTKLGLSQAGDHQILAIEDLHWIDSASEEYLKQLIDGIAGAAVLVILTYRPTYTAPFGERTYVSRIVLQPLDDTHARRVVDATLGVEELPEELPDAAVLDVRFSPPAVSASRTRSPAAGC